MTTKNIISLHGCTITQTSLPAAPLAMAHERDASGNAVEHPAKNDGNSTIVTRDGSSETRGPFAFTGDAVACARAWAAEESSKDAEVLPPAILRKFIPSPMPVEKAGDGRQRIDQDDDISIE